MTEMNRLELAKNLIQYQFPPDTPGKHYGFNIYALLNGDEVMLIDTAYEKHASAVAADLGNEGRWVNCVVISHFHEDHIMGLRALPTVPIFGSERFSVTLENHPPVGGRDKIVPTGLLRDGSNLTFGTSSLRFLSTPGHSMCSLCTVIDEKFIHVADNFMASNQGKPILPWATLEEFPAQIRSLKKIRTLSHLTLLPSHGAAVSGRRVVEREIDLRLHYLETVIENPVPLSIDEVKGGCAAGFLHVEWHNHHIGAI